MKSELEEFIRDNIEAFYSRTPDPAVLERIRQQMKEAGRKKKEKTLIFSLRPRWMAAACLILLAGGVAYMALQKRETSQTVAVTTEKATPVTAQQISVAPETAAPSEKKAPDETTAPTPRLTDIEEEEGYLRKMLLFANLRDKESPSRRLAAASQVEKITSTDNDIVDALVKTMNTDANTNVRLAALDALSKFYREPYVKKKLLSSLQKQKDPMVQIALIELLTKMKEASILKQLNRMVSDENTMQAVKDQAYSGILTFRSL